MTSSSQWLETSLPPLVDKKHDQISVFETSIRQLGGLLSAYYLTNNNVYKERAVTLADVLLQAFSSDGVLEFSNIELSDPKVKGGWQPNLAGNY